MNFALYFLGFVLLAGGLGYGAHLLGVPGVWIGTGLVALLGVGLMMGVLRTDPGHEEQAS